MTKIYLIRHAEAEGNLYRRIHGHYESLITPNGYRQIAALERRFAEERIDACYASDLLRTSVTAQAVCAPRELPLRRDRRFREVGLGCWEDVPFGQLEIEQHERMIRFNADPMSWSVEGSETYPGFTGRFLEALGEAAAAHDGGTIAVFSHGAVLRSVLQRLFYPPEEVWKIGHCDNTGVSLLEFGNGTYRLIYANDNSHLTDDISTLARQNWWRGAGEDHNVWFRPVTDGGWRYAAFRRDAWENLYGPDGSFDAGAFYAEAAEGAAGEPRALVYALLGERKSGLVQLDPSRGAAEKIGYLPFLYLTPESRGKGLGIQLIGHAVSFYRARGRERLRLCVSPKNEAAIRLYLAAGFSGVGVAPGRYGDLLLMEMPIGFSELRKKFPVLA